MAADFYYSDYAFRNNSSGSLINEREKIQAKAQKIKSKRNFKSFAAISVLLFMSVVLIYLYGQLMEANYNQNHSRNKLNTLSVKTQEIKTSIYSMYSADEIKVYAENSLGMREPSKNQVKYLSILHNDQTLMRAPGVDGKNALDFLLSLFK